MSPAVATWRPGPDTPSIRDIALHIAFWENSVANRLAGTSYRVSLKGRKPGWPRPVEELSDDQWKADRKLLTETHRRLVAAVEAFDPRRLDRPPGKRTSRVAIEFIHGVAEHSLYHGAQIKMIKRLAKAAGVA